MKTDAQRSAAADGAAPTRPLEITDIQGLKGAAGYIDPAALSPDSALVAFAIRPFAQRPLGAAAERGVPTHGVGLELGIAELDSGTWRSLTSGWDSSWGPRWSPDGRWLAFYSDRSGIPQVWLWDRETSATRLACADPVQVQFEFEVLQWLPDSARARGQAADRRLAAASTTRATAAAGHARGLGLAAGGPADLPNRREPTLV